MLPVMSLTVSASPRSCAKAMPERIDLECRHRALECPQGLPEVPVDQTRIVALPGLGGESDRFPEVVEPRRIAEVAAREAQVAEGTRRTRQAELAGERERLLGVPDAGLALSLQRLGASEVGERTDELGARRQRLEEDDSLGGKSAQRGSPRR